MHVSMTPMDSFERLLKSYDYSYPDSAVALEPAVPRDAARFLVLEPRRGVVGEDTFRNLPRYLPPRSLVVLNETKVIPARLTVTKETGGQARLLYVRDLPGRRRFEALCDRPLTPGSRVRVGSTWIHIESVEQGRYTMRLSARGTVLDLCRRHGAMPLPPYLKKTPLREAAIRAKYQTVFARRTGSVAAPTASLHITPRLLRALRAAGHEIAFVTLHVNLGTFLPLKPEQVAQGRLHEEHYEIPVKTAAAIRRAKAAGRPVVAVGTTVVRALESAATGRGLRRDGATRLFIRPGYRFRVVDGLITNFHVPRSSLLMLVAALVGRERLLRAYRYAVRRGFRLFSFGDGMLIRR